MLWVNGFRFNTFLGKTYAEAIDGDLVEAVGVIRYFAGWADKIFGQTISTTSQKFAYTLRQPIGVVAQVIPWNYPLCMATVSVPHCFLAHNLANDPLVEAWSRSSLW